jgi:hypothetical protein
MGILLRTIPMITILVALIGNMAFGNVIIAGAQQLPIQPSTPQTKNEIFQNANDSFSVVVPEGWVIEDISSTDTTVLLNELMDGYRALAQLCPQEQADPNIGNTYSCDGAQNRIYINQYPALIDEPEFASLSGNNIAPSEQFIEYQKQKLQELGYGNISVLNNTKMTINVTSTETNTTLATVPANLVEFIYTVNSTEARGYYLLAVTNATSDLGLISGYSISYDGAPGSNSSGNPPEPVRGVMQSFEFVKQGEGSNQLEEPMVQTNSSQIPSSSSNDYDNVTSLLKLQPMQARG